MNAQRFFTIILTLTLTLSLASGPQLSRAAPQMDTPPAREAEALAGNEAAGQAADLPEGVSSEWWAQAQEYIQQSEYEITWQEPTYLPELPGAYQAPNRAQGLRTYFTPQGIQLISRTESEPAWRVGISLVGYGDPSGLLAVGEAPLSPAGNRMEYQREGLAEWYLNEEGGLLQGFILQPFSSSNCYLDLALQGNLIPALAEDGTAVEFTTADGSPVLRYGEFQAVDTAGQGVPVEISLLLEETTRSTTIRLALPPLNQPVTLTTRLTSPLGVESAPEYIPGTHNWTYKNSTLQGAHAYDGLGVSVGTAGDVNADGYSDVIAGAFGFDNGQIDEGRAFVWYGSAKGLCKAGEKTCLANWTAEGELANTGLGYSVGTAGDVNGDGYDDILVGAPLWDNAQTDEGGAFVWYGSDKGLGDNGTPANAVWQAESNQADARFGVSVGAAGDVNGDGFDDIVVGAWLYDNPQINEGAVFVWYGSGNGLCTGVPPCDDDLLDADWRYESDLADTGFGWSVGTAGDVNGDGNDDIIVGTPYSDEGGVDRGKVYVWHGSSLNGLGDPTVYNKPPDWSAIGEAGGHWFGHSVSTAGDVNGDGFSDIVVGARYYTNGQLNEGAVYVYYGGVDGVQDSYWRYESNQGGSGYYGTDLGFSVSTAGDVNGDGYADILAGAPYYDNVQLDEGAAYLWYGSPRGMGIQQRPPDWKHEIDQGDDRFGCSVATAGDVNGDGYSDIIIGALGTDEGGTWDVGQVYAYYGSPGGPLDFAGGGRPETQGSAMVGFSVSTAGDVNGDGYSDIIVSTPYFDAPEYERGKVFVWYGAPDSRGVTNNPPDWQTVGEYGGDWFGHSVATAGDVNGDGYDDIIVGARFYHAHQTSEGAAYVWYGSEKGLCQVEGVACSADWKAEGLYYGTDFGFAVGTAGDVNGDGYDDILVGAPYYGNPEDNEGGIFAWYGSAEGLCAGGSPCTVSIDSAAWSYESQLANTGFGYSLGAAGDVNGDGIGDIIAGTPYSDEGGGDRGKAYVWYGSSENGLGKYDNRAPDWSAIGEAGGHWFGHSVSTAGDVNGDGFSDIVVGARYYNNGEGAEGAVYVYYGGEGGVQDAYWRYESNQYNTDLGFSVSTAGDVNGDGYADILAGAPFFGNGQDNEGAVYIWLGSAEGMGDSQRDPEWRYEIDHLDDRFGYSVATAGDMNGDGYSDIIIGAVGTDGGGTIDVGQVYLYFGSGQTLSVGAPNLIEGVQANAQLGYAVGNAGDVNGDGFGDVIVGVPYYDGGQNNEGRIYLYYGSATGIVTDTIWQAESNQAGAEFGKAVGSAGDVNGDGYSDILVGAPGYDNGSVDEGMVFAWYGKANNMGSYGLPTNASWKVEGDQAQAYLGGAVATAGDVNGDGYNDVIVGAHGYDHDQTNEGRALVYYGSAGGLASAPAWTAESDQAGAAFGKSVSTAGDVNGDGYSDVIVGAYMYDNGQTDEGRVYVYYGSRAGLPGSPTWTAESNQAQAYLGYSVGSAGDVNGDGYSDVIAGAYQYDHGATWRDWNEGAVFVWYGSASGLSAGSSPDWMADSDQPRSQFGYVVGTAGDVNDDGYSDVFVAAPAYNNGPSYEGRVFIYYGTRYTPTLMARWTAEGDQEGAALGSSAAAAGDVNGDGYADVIVGAPTFDHVDLTNTDEDVGQARVYYGNGGSVLSLLPRQMRVNTVAPIAPLGMSDSETAVELRLTGCMPLGRERVKLEWQIAPLGTPFTATNVITGTSAAWYDTGPTGLEITQQVTGLAPGTPYHWRVRLVYSGNRMGLGASRWFSLAWNGWQELDFRTASPPVEVLMVYLPVVVKP